MKDGGVLRQLGERGVFNHRNRQKTLLGRVESSGNESHGQRSADLQKLDEGVDLTPSDLLLALADVLACAKASRRYSGCNLLTWLTFLWVPDGTPA